MEWEVVLKIEKLGKGQNIAIYPFSRDFWGPFTTIGFHCPGGYGADILPELREHFKAIFLAYSGTGVMVRTMNHQFLLIDFEFIRNIEVMP